MLPSKVVVEFTPQQFAYLLRAVERDADDAREILLYAEDPDAEEELAEARKMQQFLQAVEQTQVYSH